MDLSGYALITGAGSGIGRACAIAMVEAGAAGVALMDISAESLEAVRTELQIKIQAQQLQCQLLTTTLDVTDEAAVNSAVINAAQVFGRLDHVVNSAGISFKHKNGSAEAKSTDWHRVIDINLNGTFYVYRAAAQIMLKQEYLLSSINQRALQRGTIVNISSICGVVGVPLSTAYCASKHAVIGLTRTVSEDYAAQGLRVNAVCPGYIDTPLISGDSVIAAIAREKIDQCTPLRRLGTRRKLRMWSFSCRAEEVLMWRARC